MLRFIIILLLIYLFYRVARAILFPGKNTTRFPPRQKTSGNQVIDEMVKDPVCGIYVPKREALTALHGGEIIYFCSHKCRERYLEAKKGQVS